MQYKIVVNIIPLSGTHHKKEPLVGKGFRKGLYYELCSFLYILDITALLGWVNVKSMYKKRTFYTYAFFKKI
jgi:hypothetical protein